MDNYVTIAKGIIEIGFAAASALTVLGLLIFHQYRLVPIMNALVYSSQKLIESADKLAADFNSHHGVMDTHHQNALDMHKTCREHGSQIDDLSNRLARIEGRIGV